MSTILENSSNDSTLEKALRESDSYLEDMLSYFQEGWERRGKHDEQELRTRLKINYLNTFDYTSLLVKELRVLSIEPKSTFVKLSSLTSLSVLVSLSLEDFVDDRLLSAYLISNEIESQSRSEDYRLSISFTYDSGALNREQLLSDGYFQMQTY